MAAQNPKKERHNPGREARGFDWQVAEPLELLAASRKALEQYAQQTGAQSIEPPAPAMGSQGN